MARSVKITKTKMFTVYVEVEESKLDALKKTPDVLRQAIQLGADYWHKKYLPKHFDTPAHGIYGYAGRSKSYLKQKGGRPDLVWSGGLRQDLKNKVSYKVLQTGIELKMSARILNFVPNMSQNSDLMYVKHKNSTRGYPNLKRELKVVLDEEREAIADVVRQDLERSYNGLNVSNNTYGVIP